MVPAISAPAGNTPAAALVAAAKTAVSDIMRRNPVAIHPHALLAEADEVMQRQGFHQLPVVEGGKLVGILSKRDLQAHTGYWTHTKVDAAMTPGPLTVAPGATVLEVARLLIDKQINSAPVVESERLIGIVTRTDLLQVLVRLLESASG
jgi:CBS domain-containing protein